MHERWDKGRKSLTVWEFSTWAFSAVRFKMDEAEMFSFYQPLQKRYASARREFKSVIDLQSQTSAGYMQKKKEITTEIYARLLCQNYF